MPGVTLPPDQARLIQGPIARVERVERLTSTPVTTDAIPMIFTYPGILADGVESPPWYVPHSGQIATVRVSLLHAASADHVVAVRVNGVTAQQFTLTSGNSTSLTDSAIGVQLSQYVTVETISVFDSDLAVEIRLR